MQAMRSSMASAVVIATTAVFLLFVVVAEGHGHGKGGGRNHHHSGGCGGNHTCRQLSRECKKLLFTSMVDNYLDDGDVEIITTVDKMAVMMNMLMEHRQNLTDCANETGIELPTHGGHGGGGGWHGGHGGHKGHGGHGGNSRQGGRGDDDSYGDRPSRRGGRFGRDTRFGRKGKGFGGPWNGGNFGVSAEEATELRKCMLNKTEMLNADDTLNRDTIEAQISPAFSSKPDVQAAVKVAIVECPEPEDFKIHDFIKCINKACIDNLNLDNDDDDATDGGVIP
ncbi:unnamed protein product [Meganyctiphanes norvegica]|uniref:Uncharacterized protein n=1 Tax=Meganyctiphanes norvegica TaxID=48144 RepID=A0AAV2S9L0_MEGNR